MKNTEKNNPLSFSMPVDGPNIIYIIADDMGYGDMGCYNPESNIPTPNLDRLAMDGMRFTDAHATSSVCTPSRYSVLTGRYCWRTILKSGTLWPWEPPLIEPERETVASLLRKNGYRTACFGKWHLGWEWATKNGESANKGMKTGQFNMSKRILMERNIDYTKPIRGGPVDCGFDIYFGVDVPNFPPYTWFVQDRLAEEPTVEKPDAMFGMPGKMMPGWKLEEMIPEITKRACRFIEESASGQQPFFLYLPLTSPHTPIVPNKEFIGMSGAGLYGDFVCELDWVVGKIMETVEALRLTQNTLIFFTSDNGPECLSVAAGGAYERIQKYGHYSMARMRGVKRDNWEGGHRVPFIARWPGKIPEGMLCDQLISLGDLLATCTDLLGLELLPGTGEDSISMLPLLYGKTGTPVRNSLVHHSCKGRFAIRCGDWVFIDAPSGDDNGEPDWFKKERGYSSHSQPGELFNLSDDLAERKNLYAECRGMVSELGDLLKNIKSGIEQ